MTYGFSKNKNEAVKSGVVALLITPTLRRRRGNRKFSANLSYIEGAYLKALTEVL